MDKYIGLESIIDKSKIRYNESMKKHTTIRIGGDAKCMVIPTEIDDIIKTVNYARENNIEYFVIGNGSDLVVADEGVDGIVIKVANSLDKVIINGEEITAYAGCTMPKFAQIAKKENLTGFEFACRNTWYYWWRHSNECRSIWI